MSSSHSRLLTESSRNVAATINSMVLVDAYGADCLIPVAEGLRGPHCAMESGLAEGNKLLFSEWRSALQPSVVALLAPWWIDLQ